MEDIIRVNNWDELCEHVKKFKHNNRSLESTLVLKDIIINTENANIEKMSFGICSITDKRPLNEILLKLIYGD